MSDKTEREKAQRIVAENRKAHHDYLILETYEAGLVLVGTEVKAIREGRVNLRDSFARVDNGQVFAFNVHISPYSHRGYAHHEPLRPRKLLLHRLEIRKLDRQDRREGPDPGASPDVLQGRPREARPSASPAARRITTGAKPSSAAKPNAKRGRRSRKTD